MKPKYSMVRLILAGSIGFGSQACGAQQSGSLHLTGPSTPISASYFGIHVHRPSQDTWPQVPFAEWRLWDTKGTTWYDLEPKKGSWNFTSLDQAVVLAEQHQVGLLLTLGQSPPWASSRPNGPPVSRPGGAAPPRDEEDWKNYVRTVAVRYKGRIQAYEIWNEPNLKDLFYSGTREQLVELAKDAYRIIHEVDPTAIVVSPSITGWYDVGWLNHYLDLGGGKYADVIGYHFYSSPKSPEASVAVIQQVLTSMRVHCAKLPLWDTESGYTIKSDFDMVLPPQGSLSRIVSQQDAVGYVMRAYIVNWAAGVSRLYWYDWDSNSMGVGDNLGKQKKLPAYGYLAIENWLEGATMPSCDRDTDQTWSCELYRGGKAEWIVWSEAGRVRKALPSSWIVSEMLTLSPTGSVSSSGIVPSRLVEYDSVPALLR